MNSYRTWHLEVRRIDELLEHHKNPRYITKDDAKQLKRSISKFGLIDRPVITFDGRVIGGHQRLTVLNEMGFDSVECWVLDGDELSDEEIDELNIRLNKNQGDWDWEKLANEWDVNELVNWGFDEKEFEDALPSMKKPKVTFEFEDGDELKEFVDKMQEFPEKESGGWSYKMKIKS